MGACCVGLGLLCGIGIGEGVQGCRCGCRNERIAFGQAHTVFECDVRKGV